MGWLNGHSTDVPFLCLHSPSWGLSRTARRARHQQRRPRWGSWRAWVPRRSWPSWCRWRSGASWHLRHLCLPRSCDGSCRGEVRSPKLLKHNFGKSEKAVPAVGSGRIVGTSGILVLMGDAAQQAIQQGCPSSSSAATTGHLVPKSMLHRAAVRSVPSLHEFTMVPSAVTSYLRHRPTFSEGLRVYTQKVPYNSEKEQSATCLHGICVKTKITLQ